MPAAVRFGPDDFAILTLPEFSERMAALRARLSPRLREIGEALAPQFAQAIGHPFHVHVARHARRKVNPPGDTWVALSENARGYKMLPHFQIGLFADRLFLRVGVLAETPVEARAEFAAALAAMLPELPEEAEIVFDHHRPGGESVMSLRGAPERLAAAARRSDGEVLLERAIAAEEAAQRDVPHLLEPLLPPLVDVYRNWRRRAD